eukprot:jgi/Botrbrau1/19786/Bobra.0124s0034.1
MPWMSAQSMNIHIHRCVGNILGIAHLKDWHVPLPMARACNPASFQTLNLSVITGNGAREKLVLLARLSRFNGYAPAMQTLPAVVTFPRSSSPFELCSVISCGHVTDLPHACPRLINMQNTLTAFCTL